MAQDSENTAQNDAKTEEQTQSATPSQTPPKKARQAPNIEARQRQLLMDQYPKSDLQLLKAADDTFTALWRRESSGNALGAVLIVPADGQTANWPNTIDVIRTDLPQSGWNTLSMDVRSNATKTSASSTPSMHEPDSNFDRIDAAITYLNNQGQYNIVLTGYGNSAARVLKFAHGDATSKSNKKKLRALILINPLDHDGGPVSPLLTDVQNKDMPVLDLIIGTHQFDTFDANARKRVAKENNYKKYIQLTILEPSVGIFVNENRLSRRIRGFLNTHAKGVEVPR